MTEPVSVSEPHRPEDLHSRAIFTLEINNLMIFLKCYLIMSLWWVMYLAHFELEKALKRGASSLLTETQQEKKPLFKPCGVNMLSGNQTAIFVFWCWADWFLQEQKLMFLTASTSLFWLSYWTLFNFHHQRASEVFMYGRISPWHQA